MANVSITSRCNRACPYCFARPGFQTAPVADMTFATFCRVLDFLDRSGMDQVRLLGGEPTLHPLFGRFVDESLARGKRLFIFSNGLLSDSTIALLSPLSPSAITVLINACLPGEASDEERALQRRTLASLGGKVMLGINIYRPDIELDFLLDLISTYRLRNSVRLGLAQPALAGGNSFLAPRSYPAVGAKIASFARAARERGIVLSFDCGFVPCMFPRELEELVGESFAQIGRCCGPIVDILPDATCIPCYPLSPLFGTPDGIAGQIGKVKEELSNAMEQRRLSGIYRECSLCPLRAAGRCTGGCLALSLQQFKRPSFSLPVKVTDGEPL